MDPAGVRADVEGVPREQSAGERAVQPSAGAVVPIRNHLEDTFPVLRPLASLTHWAVDLAGQVLFGLGLKVTVKGRENIPQNDNFIAVSNHASHLDYGLVAYALGEQRKKLYVLAASDYFFNTKLKRTYCQKCTHLLPMNRQVPLSRSLPAAHACLAAGNHLLVFPEGTRSLDGQLSRFKRTAAYLCLRDQVDVLPMYLDGTYEALPKGAKFFRARRLAVRIGPLLRHEQLAAETLGRGMKFSTATLRVTERIQRSVEALRDRRSP